MRTTRKAVRRECVIPQIVCERAYYKKGPWKIRKFSIPMYTDSLELCLESVYYQKYGVRVRKTKKSGA